MCGGILMRLRRCWIFRLPKWLGNQRTLRFAFLLFGEILLRVFCKEKYFAHSLTVNFLFYLFDYFEFLLFCLFFQQS